MNKTDKIYINYYIFFILIFIGIINFIIIIQKESYEYIFTLSNLYFLILNQRTFLIKYYNYFLTISCYYAHIKTNIRIKTIYNHLQIELKRAIKINQDMFNEIFNSFKKTKNKEKKIFSELMNEDVCKYINDYAKEYNLICDDFADGIAHYGLYTSSIYTFQLILYSFLKLEDLLNKLEIKGFKYDEIFYKSDTINELYPNDTNLWDEYESMNPILLMNQDYFHYLALLIQQLIQSASTYLSVFYKNKMNQLVNYVKIRIIICQIAFNFFLVVVYYFFLIPKILKKNEEMREEKNMLKIIPKNELKQILIKEDIRM
jgi:hypothetical protein